MAGWYYQCSATIADGWDRTYESDFRLDVREGNAVVWPGLGGSLNRIRNLASNPGGRPVAGDPIIVGFAKTGAVRPGICAVGLVSEEREDSRLVWLPSWPTSFLVLRPLWDDQIESRLNSVRGGMKQLTCYELSPTDEDYLRMRVARWVGTGR
jgi:hypothetical protein